jgi:Rps23 Pro-64 3,4-dihydroxylase Tpa1-like proline 4-hydroxylase
MINYSTTQLINDTELKYIDALCVKSTFFKTTNRQYFVYTLSEYDKNIFFKKILKWVESTTEMKLHSYDSYLYDSYLINYNVGDFFSKHRDSDYLKNGALRKFVVGFHLYSDYTGGDFVLYDDMHRTNILNNAGVVYLFDSDIEHEVLPIKTGIRKSIVIFINKEHLILNKTKNII